MIATFDDPVQPLHLLDANRRLDVRHPVVVGQADILFGDHQLGGVADHVRNAHSMLTQESQPRADSGLFVVTTPPSPVVSTLRA